MPTDPLAEFLISHAQAIVRLHQRGKADGFDLTPADLGMALHRSVRAWDAEAKPAAIDEYLDKLRADDFVLAVACAHGVERAWEENIEKYRPRAVRGGASADSLRRRRAGPCGFAVGGPLRDGRAHGRAALAARLLRRTQFAGDPGCTR